MFATGIRRDGIKRSYFLYRVTGQYVELIPDNNGNGLIDILGKGHGRETANCVRLRSRGGRSGYAIVVLDQQRPNDLGMIQSIQIEFDVADVDGRQKNVVQTRSLTQDGELVPKTRSRLRNLRLIGQAPYCDFAARLLMVDCRASDPGSIAMSEVLPEQVNKAHLHGFKSPLTCIPDHIGQP